MVAQLIKNLPAMQETQEMWVQLLDQEDPLEEEVAPYTSILAWKISWTEEPGGLQSKGVAKSNMTERLNPRASHLFQFKNLSNVRLDAPFLAVLEC